MKRVGDPFPVIHSVFAADALVPVLQERYEIGRIEDCALERSYVNDVFRLTSEAGARFYLKVYRRGWRSLADVAWELRLQEHLLTSAVSIARPIPRRDGSLITVLNAPEGERGAVLYAQAPGSKAQHPFTAELYVRFGRASGELHAALDTLPHASGRPSDDIEMLVMAPGRAVRAGFPPDTEERHAIDAIESRLAEEVRRQSPALDWGVCHGDLTLDNITVAQDHSITFFDFDLAALSWRARDPCGVYAFSRKDREARDFWDAFVTGYRTMRPFSKADEHAVPLMYAVQQFWDLGHEVSCWSRWSGQWRASPEIVIARLLEIQRWIDAELD